MRWIKNILKRIGNLISQIKTKFNKIRNLNKLNDTNKLKNSDVESKENAESNVLDEYELKKEQYSMLSKYDVVWAKRYATEKEKNDILDGHREGSFILLKKENDKWYGLYGTSKVIPEAHHGWARLAQSKDKTTTRTIYHATNCLYEITYDKFIRRDEILSDYQIKSLLNLMKTRGKVYPVKRKPDSFVIFDDIIDAVEVGDIISTKVNQIVVAKEGNILKCLCFHKSINDIKNGIFFKDLELIDYSNVITLDANETQFRFLTKMDKDCLKMVLFEYKERFEKQKIPQRGAVIKKDNKFYYIYGEEGQDFMVYQIIENYKEEFAKVIIKGKPYYTDFSKKNNVNKKDDFRIIGVAFEKEIEQIKNIKKSYLKEKKATQLNHKNDIKINEKTMRFGTGFKLKKNKHDTFVAISCYKGRITYISEENLNTMINFQLHTSIDSVDEIISLNDSKMLENKTKLKRLLSGYNKDY